MAEAKRVELTTVGTLKKERKPKDDVPTYRFQLTLGESNEKTCPEYSYSQLVKTVRVSSFIFALAGKIFYRPNDRERREGHFTYNASMATGKRAKRKPEPGSGLWAKAE